jgi:hypothetical protein
LPYQNNHSRRKGLHSFGISGKCMRKSDARLLWQFVLWSNTMASWRDTALRICCNIAPANCLMRENF